MTMNQIRIEYWNHPCFIVARQIDQAVQLPYACLQVDITYEEVARGMPDLLGADHAHFWMENIPALLLTDGANFRYPYYHIHADTIDELDFDFLAKICRAVVAMALSV